MGILGKINAARTVAQGMTPAGIALAVLKAIWPYLLGALLIGGFYWWASGNGYDKAKAEDATEISEIKVDRDAANAARATALAANKSLAASELLMRDSLAKCNKENARLAEDGAKAAAKARVEKQKAANTLAEWQRRYGPKARKQDCTDALATMAAVCAVEDY